MKTMVGAILTGVWLCAGLHASAAEETTGHLNADEVEAFVDGFIEREMKERRLPGALIVVIEDTRTVFSKGYGYANLETKMPWDAETVTFQAGSISKVMTATAAMKIAEEGRLDIYADVNRYLKGMRVPETFAEPVTMHHLLTHTAGFDEQYIGMHARPKAALTPLGEYLAENMPGRVMPVGRVMSYNDHTFSLAGYVVECVAEMPFEDYCEQALFQPLGMQKTTFDAPEAWLEHMAVGYSRVDGEYVAYPHDYLNVGPAAGLISTGEDMARFLKAMLNGGALGGTRVLSEESVERLTTTQFRHHEALPGMAYGWEEVTYRGHRLLQKPGGMPGINSNMYLLPKLDVALFITHNLEARTNYDALYAFLDEFYPGDEPQPVEAMAGAAERTGMYAGSYRHTRYSHDTLAKLITLMEQVKVEATGEGSLQMFGGEYVEVEPGLFKTRDGKGTVAFRVPEGAKQANFLFVGRGAYERVKWYETAAMQQRFMLAFIVVFLSIPIVALVGYRRRRKQGTGASSSWASAAQWVASVGGVLNVVFLVGLGYMLTAMDPWQFLVGLPAGIEALLVLPKVTTALAVVAAGLCVGAWAKGWWSGVFRAYYTIVVVALIAFIPFLMYWNLLMNPV